MPDGPLLGRHLDLAKFAWLTGVEPPCDVYTTQQISGDPEAGFCGLSCSNNTGFSNKAYDAACSAAFQSLPGTPEYEQFQTEAQRIFAEELPVVPRYLHLKLAATCPDLKNLMIDPAADSEFWNIEALSERPQSPLKPP